MEMERQKKENERCQPLHEHAYSLERRADFALQTKLLARVRAPVVAHDRDAIAGSTKGSFLQGADARLAAAVQELIGAGYAECIARIAVLHAQKGREAWEVLRKIENGARQR
jgi:hypothetical protein